MGNNYWAGYWCRFRIFQGENKRYNRCLLEYGERPSCSFRDTRTFGIYKHDEEYRTDLQQRYRLSLNAWVVETKDFTLNLNFNIGYNKNKIDKLADGEQEWILSSGWAGTQLLNTDDYRAYVGGRRGLIYGFVNDGFYTMDDFESFDSGTVHGH